MPLPWAAEWGNEAMVKLLLEKSAKLETKDEAVVELLRREIPIIRD